MHAASFGWAMACCGRDRDHAQDALQRAYLLILDGRAHYNGHSSFRTFVFGVIRNTAREERRFRLLPVQARDDTMALPDAEAAEAQRRTLLLRALQQLSARQREVLELVFYHDMSIEEAAEVMHVGVGSARTHYQRAKARLRILLPVELSE